MLVLSGCQQTARKGQSREGGWFYEYVLGAGSRQRIVHSNILLQGLNIAHMQATFTWALASSFRSMPALYHTCMCVNQIIWLTVKSLQRCATCLIISDLGFLIPTYEYYLLFFKPTMSPPWRPATRSRRQIIILRLQAIYGVETTLVGENTATSDPRVASWGWQYGCSLHRP